MTLIIGQCCICGEKEVELSFEHVPPQKAYNDHRIWETNIQELVRGKWDGQSIPAQGKWVQGGAGRYTLCERCNNVTGSWYGTATGFQITKVLSTLEETGLKLTAGTTFILPSTSDKGDEIRFKVGEIVQKNLPNSRKAAVTLGGAYAIKSGDIQVQFY
jgi:hypothetical protein